jgi:hypothetical protein
MTLLTDLFEMIKQRISDEKHTSKYINYHVTNRPSQPEHQISAQIFAEVEETNTRFLAHFALYRMRMKMTIANFYRSRDYAELENNKEISKEESKDGAVSKLTCWFCSASL